MSRTTSKVTSHHARTRANRLAATLRRSLAVLTGSVVLAASLTAGSTSAAAAAVTGGQLSNGCSYSARGIPSCGAYLGAAIGANTDPATFEAAMGKRMGVHRMYWRADQVESAYSSAKADLAKGRLPWISFKMPYSWGEMANGRGDAWTRNLATRLSSLPGPVWVAFHHEPEGDGNIQQWKAMQQRLAPIVRSLAPNVGYSVILTGWDELYGNAQYRLDAIWPATKIDVAGFDVYNQYGVTRNGWTITKPTDMLGKYFKPLSAFAKAHNTAWGLAETGYSHKAAAQYPSWITNTYAELKSTGGVAFTYFNSTMHSVAPWDISTDVKRADFRRALQSSTVIPPMS